MKLYSIENSPYAARARMAIAHRQLPVEVSSPPEPLRSAEFTHRFPLGKVPVLELDNGETIAESTVILDYLEDVFPENPLRPDNPLARAHDGMLTRWSDTHLPTVLFPLFMKMFEGQAPDAGQTEQLVAPLDLEMEKLTRMLNDQPPLTSRGLQLGDLCVASNAAYVDEALAFLSLDSLAERYPGCAPWWHWVNDFEAVEVTNREMLLSHRAVIAAS